MMTLRSAFVAFALVTLSGTEITARNLKRTPEKGRNMNETCAIDSNAELLSVVQRVCEMCHETYRDINPRMRQDCRSQCFGSKQFEVCFNLFKSRKLHKSR
ncbi:Crustacean neurohormone, partial [Aphelenchoides avenae]